MGIRLIAYIDNILVLAESKEQARNYAESLVYLLWCLGFRINTQKISIEAGTDNDFARAGSRQCPNGAKTPLEKIKRISAESRAMMTDKQVSGRALARLVCKMNATSQVIPPAPLFSHHLQMALSDTLNSNFQCYEA